VTNLFLIKSFISHFEKGRKLEFILLGLFSLLTSLLEIFSIGMVIPFLTILFDLELFKGKFPLIFSYFNSDQKLRFGITLIFIGLIIFSAIIRYALFVWQTRFSHSLGVEFGYKILNNFLNEDYLKFKETHNSKRVSALTLKLNQIVNQIILASLRIAYILIFLILVMISFLLFMPFEIIFLLLILFLAYFVINKLFAKKLNIYGDKINIHTNQIIKLLSETFASHKDTIIYNRKSSILSNYKNSELELRSSIENLRIIGAFPKYLIESIAIACIVIFAYYNISDTTSQTTFFPSIGFLLLGLQRLLPLAQEMHHNITEFKGGKEVGLEILSFLDMKTEYVYSVENDEKNFHCIELKKVSFAYNQNLKILYDINLHIKSGQIIGIVGQSGCGKSTLMDVIMGLVDVTDGEVLIDCKNISDIKTSWLSKISHVSQKVYILDSTIAENISLKSNVTDHELEKIKQLLLMCELDDFVTSLPDGLFSKVGENGALLSGGQIQRIGLARALYREPKVLFLDEFTGALDFNTEAKIVNTIEKLNKNKKITIIIITHNRAILKSADYIYDFN
jgi:ABC-type multidrug transport system fused ATPase/permease subunit